MNACYTLVITVLKLTKGSPCGVMAKVLDCSLKLSKLEFQSCYYIHFQINTFGKSIEPSYRLNYGLNSITAVL